MQLNRNSFHLISLSLMTLGYVWLWCFNRNPHVLVKFLTMEAYFLTWLYFLLLILKKEKIFNYSLQRLFQLNFVLQVIVTPTYWALIHNPMVQSKKFPIYEVMWNVYIHLVPIILLILDFSVNKRQFHNNWKDTAIFYYVFALPVNLIYSHIQRPVYKFLLYDDIYDYLVIIFFGLAIIFMHQICYHFLKGWNKRNKQIMQQKASKKVKN